MTDIKQDEDGFLTFPGMGENSPRIKINPDGSLQVKAFGNDVAASKSGGFTVENANGSKISTDADGSISIDQNDTKETVLLEVACDGCGLTGTVPVDAKLTLTTPGINITGQQCPECGGSFQAEGGTYEARDGKFVRVAEFVERSALN